MSNLAVVAQEVKKDEDTGIMDEIEQDKLVELETGMSREREQLPGVPKEHSGWDVYNNEAKKVDTELVNDWRDSLNSLLLFAAIFAAVLTAFIIESKKLLESDPSDAMLEVMIFFTNSMANGTFTPYRRLQFEPETTAITINCLFFASLSASLIAALASVVALQWVADYDAAITRGGSSPEDRAKRRQFRYAGVVWWKMSEIIAALPLLYSSVVLFFSGLTLWMWIIHHAVGAVVAGGMGIAVLFYGATTFLSVASVSAPFRTPLSRLIYSFVYLFFSIVDSLSCFLPILSSQEWLKERHQRYTGAVKRDNDEVKRRDWLGVDALSWLASHLSISLDSYDRLLLLVNELRKQDRKHFITPRFNEAPWFSIFDLLGWRNFNTAGQDNDISKEEMRAVAILAHCYRIPAIYAIIRPRKEILYYSDDTVDEYWSQYCDIIRVQWSPLSPSTCLNLLFLLLRDTPLPSKDTAKQIEVTIRLFRWRNSPKSAQDAPKAESRREDAPSAPSRTSAVVAVQFLKADEDLWFTQDEWSLYQAAAGRMVKLYVEKERKWRHPFWIRYVGALSRYCWERMATLWTGYPVYPVRCSITRLYGRAAGYRVVVARINSQATLSSLSPALGTSDKAIGKGATSEQHLGLIELVCRDVELCPSDAFRENVDSFFLRLAKKLQDPCLRFIGTVAAGAEGEFAEDTSLFKASWARIAKHLMVHYEGTESPTMLKMQASALFIVPGYMEILCRRALREAQTLAHLRRIFEYPVQCPWKGHDSGERHLLRHILWQFGRFKFPVNIPALTEFPMKDQYLRPTLAVLILLDGYEELLREEMHKQEIDESCTDQVLEMISIISSSQCSMLASLSAISVSECSQDLAGYSICVNKALDLPDDQGAASRIRPLVSHLQYLEVTHLDGSSSEQAIARREATMTIERLRTHLVRLRSLGATNCRVLSCASGPAT